jgi:hypothetical protein
MTKLNRIATIAALLVTLGALTGCGIGYNRTLFFTKTNVGLDIDSQPPTAEISIARREGVIAPTFEGGQTPPVLASFALDVNGFWALFAGVSSTFCGGDAAVTMASLFNTPDSKVPECNYPCEEYRSGISVVNEPNYLDCFGKKDKFKNLFGPGEIEPFLFGTDTSFGLKVAWSGMTAQAPDTVRFGFNRKEFALAPVTIKRSDKEPKSYEVRMPSFLATIDNSVRLADPTKSKVKHLQYFATGKAADKISLRYAVRKAMAERLDPVSAERFHESLEGESEAISIAFINLIHHGLDTLASDKNVSGDIQQRAASHRDALDTLANLLPRKWSFTSYQRSDPELGTPKNYTVIDEIQTDKPVRRDDFDDVASYLGSTQDAIEICEEMLKVDELTVGGEQPSNLKDQILKQRDSAVEARSVAKESIGRHPSLIAAAEYYFSLIVGR